MRVDFISTKLSVRSFRLGGRHVEHFWTLLRDLSIPHITLLDLDYGRQHGGAAAIRSIVEKLLTFGVGFDDCKHVASGKIDPDDIDELLRRGRRYRI